VKAPAYTTGETARALYLLARGALAAIRGQDPTESRWDERLSELTRTARQRDGSEDEA
jgi:hypothetical protein